MTRSLLYSVHVVNLYACTGIASSSVGDPEWFCTDPDPAFQAFQDGIRILPSDYRPSKNWQILDVLITWDCSKTSKAFKSCSKYLNMCMWSITNGTILKYKFAKIKNHTNFYEKKVWSRLWSVSGSGTQSKELGRGPSEIVSTFWRKVSLCRLQRSKEAVQITIILTEEWFVLSCRTSLCLFIIKEYD